MDERGSIHQGREQVVLKRFKLSLSRIRCSTLDEEALGAT